MLKLASFLLILFASFSLRAGSNPLLRYLAASGPAREEVLFRMIAKRCSFYLPLGKVTECQNIVDELLSYLDHDLVVTSEDSFLFVAFKTELRELMSDESTSLFLEGLNQRLVRRISHDDLSFNLYRAVRELTSSDRKAAKLLAILLQDTSPKKCHLAYLARTPNPSPVLRANVEALSQLIDNLALLAEQTGSDQALFYPAGVGAEFNPRSLYHFYLPYYLGLRLAYANALEFSYVAPLMLTLTYEFVTTGDDLSYLYRDPESLANDWKVRDVFAGHVGAALAVGKAHANFAELKEKFRTSTSAAVELLSY